MTVSKTCGTAVKILLGLFLPLGLLAAENGNDTKKYWLDHPGARLSSPKSHGFSVKSVLKQQKANRFKVERTRPKLRADLTRHPGSSTPGTANRESVELEVLEESGVSRSAQVTFGLPLPQGAVFSPEKIRITDVAGTEIPSQFSISALWPDGSVKWALGSFYAGLKANESKKFRAEFGNSITRNNAGHGITLNETADFIDIDAGKVKARIGKKRFRMLQNLSAGGKKVGTFGALQLTRADGFVFNGSKFPPDSVRVIEKGPRRVTIQVEGRFATTRITAAKYCIRFTFDYGQSSVRMEYKHVSAEMRWEFTDWKSLNIPFTVPGENAVFTVTDDSGRPIEAAGRVMQADDRNIITDTGVPRPGRISGAVAVQTGKNRLAVALADGWKRYPKAFSFSGNTLTLELLPVQPHDLFNRDLPFYLVFPFCGGNYRMKWGMGFSETLVFDFSGNMAAAEAEASLPVVALLPPAWYDKTGVFPGCFTSLGGQLDKFLKPAVDGRLRQVEEQREYGFFNYGDSFGERKVNWVNNEYDMAHGMFLYGLRTQRRDVLRYARAAARHQADVDICQAYPDEYYLGANLTHSCGHTGAQGRWSRLHGIWAAGTNGHTWINGMIDAYQLFGDFNAMDSALLTGDHLAFAVIPNFRKFNQVREAGWMLRALCGIAGATGDEAYARAAGKLADFLLREIDCGREWWENRSTPNTRGPVIGLFICGVVLNGLCDYYEFSKREDVKAKIGEFSRWMLKSFAPGFGCGFFYDTAIDTPSRFPAIWLNVMIGIPLLRGAVICDDAELYRVGRLAMTAQFTRPGSPAGKECAQELCFLGEFYQSAARWAAEHAETEAWKFDRGQWRDIALAQQEPALSRRGGGKVTLRILRPEGAELELRRIFRSAGKPENKPGYRMTTGSGREYASGTFDPSRPESRVKIPLDNTTEGEKFHLEISDDLSSHYLILPSRSVLPALVSENGEPFFLPYNELRDYYFLVPAGCGRTVELTGVHQGFFGAVIRDESGKILAEGEGYKRTFSLSRSDSLSLKIAPAPRGRIIKITTWAAIDLLLKIPGVTELAATPDYFSGSPELFRSAEAAELYRFSGPECEQKVRGTQAQYYAARRSGTFLQDARRVLAGAKIPGVSFEEALRRLRIFRRNIEAGLQWRQDSPQREIKLKLSGTKDTVFRGEYDLGTRHLRSDAEWRIGCDAEYFRVSADFPVSSPRIDSAAPWRGDCLEIFIRPDRQSTLYREIIAVPDGSVYSVLNAFDPHRATQLNLGGRHNREGIKNQVTAEKGRLQYNCLIPWKLLEKYTPFPVRSFSFMLVRTRCGSRGRVIFSSPVPHLYSGHNIFGYLNAVLE